MIYIDKSLLIAEGSERECFAHPSMPGYCLKVPKNHALGRNCPQCRVDVYTSERLRARRVPLVHTAQCHGWVNTNMGPAILVEKITDMDGKISLTLKQSLEAGSLTWPQVEEMLSSLKKWAVESGIVISELNVKNLMHRRGQTGDHLVVIDGLGGRKPDLVFFLRQHIIWMARHKTIKRWPREFNKVKTAALNIIQGRDQNVHKQLSE